HASAASAASCGDRHEQMGKPADRFSVPASPFVAEYNRTMNRLEATVVDGSSGAVDHGGIRLMLESARGRPNGERVLVLVRPEALEVEAANGAVPSADGNMLSGEVITHTFLGPVTRLKVVGPPSDLI